MNLLKKLIEGFQEAARQDKPQFVSLVFGAVATMATIVMLVITVISAVKSPGLQAGSQNTELTLSQVFVTLLREYGLLILVGVLATATSFFFVLWRRTRGKAQEAMQAHKRTNDEIKSLRSSNSQATAGKIQELTEVVKEVADVLTSESMLFELLDPSKDEGAGRQARGAKACRVALESVALLMRRSVLKQIPENRKRVCLIWFNKRGNAFGWALAGYPETEASAEEARIGERLKRHTSCAGWALDDNEVKVIANVKRLNQARYKRISNPPVHEGLMAGPTCWVLPNHVMDDCCALCLDWLEPLAGEVSRLDMDIWGSFSKQAGAICSIAKAMYGDTGSSINDFLKMQTVGESAAKRVEAKERGR